MLFNILYGVISFLSPSLFVVCHYLPHPLSLSPPLWLLASISSGLESLTNVSHLLFLSSFPLSLFSGSCSPTGTGKQAYIRATDTQPHSPCLITWLSLENTRIPFWIVPTGLTKCWYLKSDSLCSQQIEVFGP